MTTRYHSCPNRRDCRIEVLLVFLLSLGASVIDCSSPECSTNDDCQPGRTCSGGTCTGTPGADADTDADAGADADADADADAEEGADANAEGGADTDAGADADADADADAEGGADVDAEGGCTGDNDCEDDDPCTVDFCITASGVCVNQPMQSGQVCDQPEDSCDPIGSCDDFGECTYLSGIDCTDGDPCTNEYCLDGGCRYDPNVGAECDDDLDCWIDDRCDTFGECRGTRLKCDDRQPCTEDSCNEQNGASCSANQRSYSSISCGGTVEGTTAGRSNHGTSFVCPDGTHPAPGPEVLYVLGAPPAGTVTLSLEGCCTAEGTEVFVLPADCSADECLGDGTISAPATFTSPGFGSFWILVDGPVGGGTYQLSVTCPT